MPIKPMPAWFKKLRKRTRPGRIDPIVEDATFEVRCACGFGCDSNALTQEAAEAEMAARHQCSAVKLHAEPLG